MAVDFSGQFKQHGNGFGCAKVFIHRCLEARCIGLAPVYVDILRSHQTERGVQALERAAGIVKMGVAVVERTAVMRAQDKKSHRFGVVLRQHFADGEEVTQAFGHFFVVHPHKAVVHPKTGQRFAVGAFALGDFIFVVRKLQVSPAAVNVKALAKRGTAHGRAFNMPAGSSLTVFAGPFGVCRLTVFGGFPEHEVQRVLLAVKYSHALTGAQIVERLARKLSVARKLAHSVIDITAAGAVGQTFLLQCVDDLKHLRHVVGGARLNGGRLDTQRADVLVHGGDHFVSQRAYGHATL